MERETDCDINYNWCIWNGPQRIVKGTRSACGVMVIVVGNGHGDTSSNPGRD